MKTNINQKPLMALVIPKRYTRPNGLVVDNYDLATDLHFEDGWRDIVEPDYEPIIEMLGDVIKKGKIYTYEIIKL